MISQKIRYQVLERDGNCCKSCGQKPQFVMLEVDHIIPKKKGGNDNINNLQTLCFNCNRGKGSLDKGESIKNLRKNKESDMLYNASKEFTSKWNSNMMGTIDNNTYRLLLLWINKSKGMYENIILEEASNQILKEFSDKYGYEWNKHIKEIHNSEGDRYLELIYKFKLGGDYCDYILNKCYNIVLNEQYPYISLYEIIQEVYDDSKWNREWKGDYGNKLNYELTQQLFVYSVNNNYAISEYVIRKFTKYPKLLSI